MCKHQLAQVPVKRHPRSHASMPRPTWAFLTYGDAPLRHISLRGESEARAYLGLDPTWGSQDWAPQAPRALAWGGERVLAVA